MGNIETTKGEIVMYQPDETIRLEVRVEDETVWLNRQQMASLFGRDVKTIGKHINNALKEELANVPTVANFAIVQIEGSRKVNRTIEFYNLDIVVVGTVPWGTWLRCQTIGKHINNALKKELANVPTVANCRCYKRLTQIW
jgi:hypothetical protein